jgi:Kef-type K+ transport system membrane component KefB
MVMGIVVVNLAKHHSRPFNAIEGIEWPFLILFFILSGASLHVEAIASAGFFVVCYVVLRILGRFLGASTGALLSGADTKVRKYIWLGLMPQAGIALGLALYACQRFQELSEVIMPVIISGTIIFEFFGPVMTKIALKTSGETNIT